MAKLDWNALDFETAVEESGVPISFEKVGDVFIGEYVGKSHIVPPLSQGEDDNWNQLNFRDESGSLHVLNAGAKLDAAFDSIETGSIVRITRMSDVEMKDAGKNPMKDYRVDVAKAK